MFSLHLLDSLFEFGVILFKMRYFQLLVFFELVEKIVIGENISQRSNKNFDEDFKIICAFILFFVHDFAIHIEEDFRIHFQKLFIFFVAEV